MRDATAALAAALLLLAAPACAELLEFDATLSIESLETLFPLPAGFNGAYETLAPGHGVASVTSLGGIAGFASVTGLWGTAAVGDIGTDAIFDLWELSVGGVGSPAFSGAPLHGPMALFLGDVRRIVGIMPGTTSTTLTFLRTRNGTLGPGLGGTFTSATPSATWRVEFGTWTTGMLTLTDLVPGVPGYTSPATAGFDARTADGLGTLQMVTPVRWEVVGSSPPFPVLARYGGFGVLRLEFLPEPARAVMLASGATLLFALGRRRTAKSRH